jgi:hypothetical protein
MDRPSRPQLHDAHHALRPILDHDGAAQFAGSFDAVFASDGVTIIRTPPYTPVANAFTERWVGTVRRELCDRTLIGTNDTSNNWCATTSSTTTHTGPILDNLAAVRCALRERAVRPGRPIRRHSTCHGLINEYHTA